MGTWVAWKFGAITNTLLLIVLFLMVAFFGESVLVICGFNITNFLLKPKSLRNVLSYCYLLEELLFYISPLAP